ncbi:MAG: ketoacyl-ACP synthase III [Spirochaetia bacterium]|nr:ketoacyl-ACP synthase III [Spirochaetia bacterium]
MIRQASIDITAVGGYLPLKVVVNDDFASMVATSNEWITSHTGIRERRFASVSMLTSDMAAEAARSMSVDLSDVDGIIVATATPDYQGFPSTACVLVEKLGLSQVKIAFDLVAGCTGFVYALEQARALVHCGSCRKMLVVGAEKMSSVLDFSDRNTCVLFGDGAGCVIVEEGDGLKRTLLGVEGKGADSLYINQSRHIVMNGRAVYNFAVTKMTEIIARLTQEEGISLADISWIVPHQANERIIKAAAERLGVDVEKFYLNVSRYANTSAATIPLALWDMEKEGKLKQGDILLLVAFGAGLTYGGNCLVWKK